MRRNGELMNEYDDECLRVFLENQGQLFEDSVAETPEEAEAILEECLAVVCNGLDDVRDYMEERGLDVDGISDEMLEEAAEVFTLSDDRYLVVIA